MLSGGGKKLVFKDFSDKAFSNTLFPRKQESHARPFVIGGAILFAIGFGIFLFLRSPWFFVQHIIVSGTTSLSASDVERTLEAHLARSKYFLVPGKHSLFVDTEECESALLHSYALEMIQVFLNDKTLFVELRERPTGVFVQGSNASVFADLDGNVVRAATSEEAAAALLPNASTLTLRIDDAVPTDAGAKIFEAQDIGRYKSLKLKFEVETGLEVSAYSLPRTKADWIKVTITDKREIYFDLGRAIDSQLRKLITLLKEQGTELAKVSYIDLRYPDRVYYR